MPESDNAYQIVWLVRRLFRAMAQSSNQSLQDLGISAADRAVMEFLYPDEELSVPEIAERYQVSRQHVQATVNNLVEAGILTKKANPRHKRSQLLVLTNRGKSLFKRIEDRDAKTVKRLFSKISEEDKRVTLNTLKSLLARLK